MPSRPDRRSNTDYRSATRRRRASRPDLAAAAVDDFRRIIRVLRIAARQAEVELGLSGAQLFVLQKLVERPAASLNELADRTLTHQSSVSVVVSRLIKRGLVLRDRSPVDARRISLRLSPAGERLARQVGPAPQMLLVEMIRSLRPAELRTFTRLLHQLAEAMGAGRVSPDMMFGDRDIHKGAASHTD